MTNRKQGPPVSPNLDAGLRAWADADRKEQKRAFEERVKRLRAGEKPNRAMELLQIIAGRKP